jgi:hypothetical protein
MEYPIKNTTPWLHWVVDNFLTTECLNELKLIDSALSQTLPGRRYGSERLFVDESNAQLYPELFKLYQSMLFGEYKTFFEEHTNESFDGLFPRLEVISDIGEFSINPHTDRKEKKLTAIVYTDHTKLYPATALDENTRIEAKDNRCFFFIPSDDTWHSYPPTTFETVRRCLHINYWTYEVE